MDAIVVTVFTGLAATAVMSGALYLIHWSGFTNADMIRAVGSTLTRREEGAFGLGFLVHFASGVIFAFIYIAFWSLLSLENQQAYLILGLATGTAHGLVVSFLLVAVVAEHHPLPQFREAGLSVAVAHLLGHVVYGAVLGVLAGSLLLRFDIIPVLVRFPG